MRVEKRLKLINPKGFHVRPATKVAKQALQFECEIHLLVDDQQVNAKSAMRLMTVASEQGTEMVVIAEGDDAQAAVEAIEKLFKAGFDEMDEAIPPPRGQMT